MSIEFVLVDYENVQPKNLDALNGRAVQIKVFLGTHQARIPVATAHALQAFGTSAEYIQIDGSGRNALDFHLAYYLGRLAAEHPGSSFHIVSKDTDYDPLIRHLRSKGISCQRTKDLTEMAASKVPRSKGSPTKCDAAIDNLRKRKSSRPRTPKTLRSTINAQFANSLSDSKLDALVGELVQSGKVKIANGKVEYDL